MRAGALSWERALPRALAFARTPRVIALRRPTHARLWRNRSGGGVSPADALLWQRHDDGRFQVRCLGLQTAQRLYIIFFLKRFTCTPVKSACRMHSIAQRRASHSGRHARDRVDTAGARVPEHGQRGHGKVCVKNVRVARRARGKPPLV